MRHGTSDSVSTYSLDLTGIDLDNPDPRRDKLLSQGIGEAADSGLGGTVDATTRVSLASCNTSNVDNVSATAILSLLEDGEDGLGHVDKAGDVGGEHDVHVLRVDLRSLCNTLNKTTGPIMSTNRYSLLSGGATGGESYALLTRISMSRNSAGKEGTKFLTSSGLLTSSLTGSTLTPSPTSSLIS